MSYSGYPAPGGVNAPDAVDERADDVMDRPFLPDDPITLDDFRSGDLAELRALRIGVGPVGPDGIPIPDFIPSDELWR